MSQYRRLIMGEIVQRGDEFYHDELKKWVPVLHGIGRECPDPSYTSHTQYRRKI